MKRTMLIAAASLILSAAAAVCGAGPAVVHGSSPSAAAADSLAHEEIVDGVKATFRVLDMKQSMLFHGVSTPGRMQGTHHLAVVFRNSKSGRLLTEGKVRAKIIAPDGGELMRDLALMKNHFGSDVDLSKKGRYGIMVKFKVDDDLVREVRFWYTVN